MSYLEEYQALVKGFLDSKEREAQDLREELDVTEGALQRAELANAEQAREIALLELQVLDLDHQRQVAQDLADVRALRIAELEQRLADCEEPDPDPEPDGEPLIGAWSNTGAAPGGARHGLVQSFRNFESTCGPIQAFRVYDSGQGISRMERDADALGAWERGEVWGSSKHDVAALATRHSVLIAQIRLQLGNAAAKAAAHGRRLVWIPLHEWDLKIRQGQYTQAQLKAAFTVLSEIGREFDNVVIASCMTGYEFVTRIGWGPTPDQYDILATDPYIHTLNDTLAEYQQVVADYAAQHGLKWAITETGFGGHSVNPSDAQVATFVERDLRDWFLKLPVAAGLMFFNSDADASYDWCVWNKPHAAATVRALPRPPIPES